MHLFKRATISTGTDILVHDFLQAWKDLLAILVVL